MAGRIIAATVIAILILIFTTPIHVRIGYSEQLTLAVKVLFFKIISVPAKKKRKKKEKKEKPKAKKKKSNKKPQKSEKPSKSAAKKTLSQRASSAKELASLILELISVFIRRFSHHLRVKLHRLKITVASDDPAKTAVEYGAAVQGTAYLLEFLSQSTNLIVPKGSIVRVEPDFTAEKFKAEVDIDLSIALWQLIDTALRMGVRFIKRKIKNTVK